jgi:tRNA (cmo5U34)-methyltransferase
MLTRAKDRISAQTMGKITLIQDDMRNLDLPYNHFDIVLAAATFHHLRTDADWELVFTKIYHALKPGGSIWISDLIAHDSVLIDKLFQDQYGAYLKTLGGEAYKQKVLDYIEYEDTPRSVNYQLDLLKKVGFSTTEILHKNACFAAFGAIK